MASMVTVLVLVALLSLFLVLRDRKQRKASAPAAGDLPAALEAWVIESLAVEFRREAGLTSADREKLKATLAGDPEPEIVAVVAEAVRRVELEYTRLPHESDAELALVVRYEDGREGRRARRVPLTELPADVRDELTTKAVTRVFRGWSFSWDR